MHQRGNNRSEMRASSAGSRQGTGRLAAGAAVAAFLIAGARITAELLPDDGFGLAPYALTLWWGVGGAALAALAIPTWLGRRWPRRLLGVCCLAGSAGAVYWLSSEDQSDIVGLLAGVSVAVLLAAAFLAAAFGERTPLAKCCDADPSRLPGRRAVPAARPHPR